MGEDYRPPIKDVDPEDPMEFVGMAFPGDTRDAMAECFVEEYILQGFQDDMILRLFSNPDYAITHAYFAERGEPYIRDLISRVRGRWGHPRFTTQVTPAGLRPDPEDEH